MEIESIFPPFEPEGDLAKKGRRGHFRRIPIRTLIPNIITLLALCMGLTAIRMGIEGRYELAVAAIVAAAVLDMLDGQVARLLKSTSRFGAELDSLADFLNFGVAPSVLLYNWALKDLKSAGWIAVLCFAIACALRLARFNVALDSPKPAWQSNFFVGMPAPAGALVLMLPIYVNYLYLVPVRNLTYLILFFTLAVAFMLISRLPTYSGKLVTQRVPREAVLPIFVFVVLFAAFLISYPWETLTIGATVYLSIIPLGIMRYRQLEARHSVPAEAPVVADTQGGDGSVVQHSGKVDEEPAAKLH